MDSAGLSLSACLAVCHGKHLQVFIVFVIIFSFSVTTSHGATTDAGEVKALEAIASKLVFTTWNFSVDPCLWNYQSAPYIKCDCTNTTCHVTTLNFYNLNLAAEIPLEFTNFTHLTTLTMGLNLFYGEIPRQLGSMTSLTNIDFGINQLSGSIPPELGNLTNLNDLGFGSNLFTGSFPKELCNLVGLTGLWMDGSGLSGELPAEFGQLTKLQTVWMFANGFSGSIPDVFGNMSGLTELRMYGNNFSGPIPSSLLSRRSLQILSIGDLSNGGNIPSSFGALTSLKYLSLRRNGLSGTVPEDIGNLANLSFLDLSFNNLTGTIPASFAKLSNLQKLFLANNSLKGNITVLGEIQYLSNLDVSYNELSGSIPTWVNKTSLEANLLWNFFNQTDENTRLEFVSFNCLDKSCDRTSAGKNANFAINCGGPSVNVGSTIYSADNEALGNSSYFQSSDGTWGVSYTGYDDSSFSTILSTSSLVRGTSDQGLYSSARGAANSLKYYGYSMINGNYTVELHFAEISIPVNGTWQATGRRKFDVYLQGLTILKDFDIRSEANDSLIALVKRFTAEVKENVLEIHFLWAGKGTCCAPTHWTYGPLVSAIRVSADFYVPPNSSSSSSKSKLALIVVPIAVVLFIGLLLMFILWRKKWLASQKSREILKDVKPNMFAYNELKSATEDFCAKNKLGEGGFGTVYKGQLSDGRMIAVKQLSSGTEKGTNEFLNEVATMTSVQHRNLVKLLGCCIHGNRKLLVFEFLENNSLAQSLKVRRLSLDWPARFNICTGVARGLAYLHEESRIRIVHRDIKADNILLDQELNPKIADFGLAKLFNDDKTHVSTRVAGTIGYLAPEYAFRGKLTEKADVYSYGILLLEIVSGRCCTDHSLPADQVYLLEWAWHLYEENKILELVDESLKGNFPLREVERVIHIALLCTQAVAQARPKMSEALAMLTETSEIILNISRPGFLADLKQFTMNQTYNPLDSTSTVETSSSLDLIPGNHKMERCSNQLSDIVEPR